jgi:hypothetical protein
MTGYHAQTDPQRTLSERLEQLNENLHALSLRLKDAIASAVSTAVGDAIRDAVRRLLGRKNALPWNQQFDQVPRDEAGLWNDFDESSWDVEDDFPAREQEPFQPSRKPRPNRWGNALGMAMQTAIWWMWQQPHRRPVLTTTVVAVAAGVTAFLAGPALTAGVGVLASTAGLLMTTNTVKSAGEQLRLLAPG